MNWRIDQHPTSYKMHSSKQLEKRQKLGYKKRHLSWLDIEEEVPGGPSV